MSHVQRYVANALCKQLHVELSDSSCMLTSGGCCILHCHSTLER